MRILLIVVILAAAAWAGYWVLGSRSVERGLQGWFAAREAEGWSVHVDGIDTVGFPSRFDTTLTALDIADPETGVAWSAPFFQILALSYKPHHVIAVWPDRQRLATPNQKIDITSETLRGSVVFEPGPSLALDRSTVEFSRIGLASTADWRAALDGGQLALRRTPLAENSYDLSFEARDLTLPTRLTEMLARTGLGSDTAQGVRLEASVVFDRPWDRFAIEDRRPQPTKIDLKLASATWGELDLKLAGELDVDARGLPTGEITVKATNWREMLDLAEHSGLLAPQIRPLMERGLQTLAGLSGNKKTLDLPLTFRDGQVVLGGFLPVGPAPVLRLR
ncbi:DUF2125 domain-containing protein [Fluviibacterium sp. DFM31]|uniref:DUF2125 domain-containing protein n=1 Tax=Meridianimarinicoccus marinus TaxID=3231483 RepID=A0ABV3L3S2_9RHOB